MCAWNMPTWRETDCGLAPAAGSDKEKGGVNTWDEAWERGDGKPQMRANVSKGEGINMLHE